MLLHVASDRRPTPPHATPRHVMPCRWWAGRTGTCPVGHAGGVVSRAGRPHLPHKNMHCRYAHGHLGTQAYRMSHHHACHMQDRYTQRHMHACTSKHACMCLQACGRAKCARAASLLSMPHPPHGRRCGPTAARTCTRRPRGAVHTAVLTMHTNPHTASRQSHTAACTTNTGGEGGWLGRVQGVRLLGLRLLVEVTAVRAHPANHHHAGRRGTEDQRCLPRICGLLPPRRAAAAACAAAAAAGAWVPSGKAAATAAAAAAAEAASRHPLGGGLPA